MTDFVECDCFQDHRRLICRGERIDLPLDGPGSINAYRVHWGLAPITERASGSSASVKTSEGGARPITQEPRKDAPSLLQQVATFSAAFANHVKDGLVRCEPSQIEERLASCRECPEFTGSHCRKCGCACNGDSAFFNKLAWRSEHCPLDRW